MATVITHGIFGSLTAKVLSTFVDEKLPRRFWFYSIIAPILPDIDVLAFLFGIPYHSPFGHRGLTHSLFFAFVFGYLLSMFVFKGIRDPRSKKGWGFVLYFSFLIASHGFMDAFTNGGLGIAFFLPVSSERYFMPITPIVVSPIGIKGFFSKWGLQVIISEFVFIIIPSGLLFFLNWIRVKRKRPGL